MWRTKRLVDKNSYRVMCSKPYSISSPVQFAQFISQQSGIEEAEQIIVKHQENRDSLTES